MVYLLIVDSILGVDGASNGFNVGVQLVGESSDHAIEVFDAPEAEVGPDGELLSR